MGTLAVLNGSPIFGLSPARDPQLRLLPAEFSERLRTATNRTARKSAETKNKVAAIGRRWVATGIATPAPVHKVRYAAMHIGHFGSRTSSAPEPTHPLVPCHQLCCGRRPVRTLQHFIVPIEVAGFPSRYEEEANFRSLLNTMENIPYPPEPVEDACGLLSHN